MSDQTVTLKDLLEQQAKLVAQIAAIQNKERDDALTKIKALVAEHGFKAAELFNSGSPKATPNPTRASKPVAAKYKDPVSGKEWSGRGIAPKWIALFGDEQRKEFLINK